MNSIERRLYLRFSFLQQNILYADQFGFCIWFYPKVNVPPKEIERIEMGSGVVRVMYQPMWRTWQESSWVYFDVPLKSKCTETLFVMYADSGYSIETKKLDENHLQCKNLKTGEIRDFWLNAQDKDGYFVVELDLHKTRNKKPNR